MLKKLLALGIACFATLAMAAVDANKADPQELTTIKGIGPATAQRIVDARQEGAFKSWDDFIARVKGIAHASAARLSEAGLTINGKPYDQAAGSEAAPAAKAVKPVQSTGKKPEKS